MRFFLKNLVTTQVVWFKVQGSGLIALRSSSYFQGDIGLAVDFRGK